MGKIEHLRYGFYVQMGTKYLYFVYHPPIPKKEDREPLPYADIDMGKFNGKTNELKFPGKIERDRAKLKGLVFATKIPHGFEWISSPLDHSISLVIFSLKAKLQRGIHLMPQEGRLNEENADEERKLQQTIFKKLEILKTKARDINGIPYDASVKLYNRLNFRTNSVKALLKQQQVSRTVALKKDFDEE